MIKQTSVSKIEKWKKVTKIIFFCEWKKKLYFKIYKIKTDFYCAIIKFKLGPTNSKISQTGTKSKHESQNSMYAYDPFVTCSYGDLGIVMDLWSISLYK